MTSVPREAKSPPWSTEIAGKSRFPRCLQPFLEQRTRAHVVGGSRSRARTCPLRRGSCLDTDIGWGVPCTSMPGEGSLRQRRRVQLLGRLWNQPQFPFPRALPRQPCLMSPAAPRGPGGCPWGGLLKLALPSTAHTVWGQVILPSPKLQRPVPQVFLSQRQSGRGTRNCMALYQWFSKCASSGSMRVTWELIKKVSSRSPPQSPGCSGRGPSNLF